MTAVYYVIIILASRFPHIPENLSISSGAAEDVFDNSKEGKMLDRQHPLGY